MKQDYTTDINDEYENNNEYRILDNFQKLIYVIFFVFLFTGFIVYMGEKKIEYKKNFSYLTFVFGKPSCRGNSPDTKLIESFMYAFK